MSHSSAETGPTPFTVGICAAGDEPNSASLLTQVLEEARPQDQRLEKVVFVASQCPPGQLSQLERISKKDNRVSLLVEETRGGKAEAVNRIISSSSGDFLVLVNADAIPEPGAISKLVSVAKSDGKVGSVSATPVVEPRSGFSALLVSLMWSTHNASSLALNHMGISNHATDELVAFRSSVLRPLPTGTVNDGAFLTGSLKLRGYLVKVCPTAAVRISTPKRAADLIRQRRRILFGHAQVWKGVGSPPKTIETLLVFSTSVGLRLLVRTLARRPRLILALPAAAVAEVSASILAILDSISASKKHAIWKRFK